MQPSGAGAAGRLRTRAMRLVLGGHADATADPAATVRDLFFRFLIVICAFTVPMLVSGEVPAGWRIAGASALTVLMVAWFSGHRWGRFPGWVLAIEGTALVVLGIALGNPSRILGVLYFALWLRA